jgi:inhibitor of cysteine peptidase
LGTPFSHQPSYCYQFGFGGKMRRYIPILGLIIMTALVLTACSGKTIKINADDNGGTVEMKKGETLILSINGNPTTGYTWEVESVDQNVLQSAGKPDYKSDSMLVGSGGTYKFKFTAASAGVTPLKLKYWRTFEPDNPPVETFEVKIVVK